MDRPPSRSDHRLASIGADVHVFSGGYVLLLHSQPAYTVYETQSGPFELLVSLNRDGRAEGHTFVDDGDGVFDPRATSASSTLYFRAGDGRLTISKKGQFRVGRKLVKVTILGIRTAPSQIAAQATGVEEWSWDAASAQLTVHFGGEGLDLDAGKSSMNWT